MLELRWRVKIFWRLSGERGEKEQKKRKKKWKKGGENGKTRRFVDEADMVTRSRIKSVLHQFSCNFMAISRSLVESCHRWGRKGLRGARIFEFIYPCHRRVNWPGKEKFRIDLFGQAKLQTSSTRFCCEKFFLELFEVSCNYLELLSDFSYDYRRLNRRTQFVNMV